mgnify:CR=1 FL=1
MEWQPIETAPKNGEEIIVFVNSKPAAAKFAGNCWEITADLFECFYPQIHGNPTHWMKLNPPEQEGIDSEGGACD